MTGDFQTILRVVAGSRAYGLETPESDSDSRGVCIPGKVYLLGLDPFEQIQDERGDHVIFGIHKFVRLALECNPNIIELLYTDDILEISPEGQRLRDIRQLFLSRKVADRFGQYALHQLRRMENHRRWWSSAPTCPQLSDFGAHLDKEGKAVFSDPESHGLFEKANKQWNHYQRWRTERNPARAALEERFGYDTKHAMHLCRLLNMGVEILRDGAVHVRRPDGEWLRCVRLGQLTYEELLGWARAQEEALHRFSAKSVLPLEPDRPAVLKVLIELLDQYYWPSSSPPSN